MRRTKSATRKSLTLAQKVSDQLDEWIAAPRSPAGKVKWVESYQGKAYVRFNGMMDKIDLAAFEIKPSLRRKGIAKSLIAMACDKPVSIVRVENISVPAWALKVIKYKFDGRKTVVREGGETELDIITHGMATGLCCVTVDFERPEVY